VNASESRQDNGPHEFAKYLSTRTRKSDRLKLYVVALGTSYAVLDRTVIVHGYAVALVFDHNWNFVDAQQVF